MVSVNSLTLEDVEFLQAVNQINKQPENYPNTDISEVPANSKNIRKSTELNSNQVSYRMGGNSNSRGLAEAELIVSHSPLMLDDGYGPRSVHLTEAGADMLADAKSKINTKAGISRKEFEQLQAEIKTLRNFWKQTFNIDIYEDNNLAAGWKINECIKDAVDYYGE